jgi:hypothetical protein
VSVAGESALWVGPAEIPADNDIGKPGQALAAARHGKRDELMANTAAYICWIWDIHLTGVESVAAAEARRSSMAGSLRGGRASARVPSRVLEGPGAASWRR